MINICFATDENYLKYMATTMLSILENCDKDDEFHFYILCNKVSEFSKKYIKKLQETKSFDIDFIDIDINEFNDFPAGGPHISNTTYFRYKIAEIIPDIEKIIYLDCDIIVTESLSELFNTNIENYYLAGVEDVGYYYWRDFNKDFIYRQEPYINAGMLLINLKKWRSENLYQKLMKYTLENTDIIKIGDQDVINKVCENKILKLDYKWNVQDSFFRHNLEVAYNPCKEEIIETSEHPCILHYTNVKKPWNDLTIQAARYWHQVYLSLTQKEMLDPLRLEIFEKYTTKNLNLKLENINNRLICIEKKLNKPTFLQQIFSIKNENNHKVIRILGIKTKFRRKNVNKR